jgi:U3 small nucleolar RNA-associated protein 14
MGKRSQQISDVYEFQQEKYRRSNVTIAVGKDEAAEFNRSDDEGEIERAKVKLIGENEDDERVDSDDDEDIDSDAAFGESDEETFAGYGFQRQVYAPILILIHIQITNYF